MTRETKTTAEAEAFILERLKAMPGGNAVETVYVVVDEDDGDDPSGHFGICWIGPGDMREIMREASRLYGRLRREYYLVVESRTNAIEDHAATPISSG